MEGPSTNTPAGCCAETIAMLESRLSCLEESMNRAVGSLLPKVEALLSERNEAEGSAPSSRVPPPTTASPPPSLLQLAERGDAWNLLQMLVDERVDVRNCPPRTGSGDTALHVAASGGHLKAVIVLLGAGAHVDVSGHRLRRPLHCAAAHGHLAVTQHLLDAGAKVDFKDGDGATALKLATEKGYTELVCLLVEMGAHPNKNLAFIATSQGNRRLVELFLQKGVSADSCNASGESILVQAARGKRWNIVDLLLEKGASATKCTSDEECALVFASQDDQADTVRHLLRRGVASNSEQMELALVETQSAAVVWAFVDALSDEAWQETGHWCLFSAAEKSHMEPLVAVLEAGVDIDSKDDINQTSLYFASANGHVECVRELLSRGADSSVKNENGDTPLHAASSYGHVECVRALLAAGANASVRNNKKKTPLELATTDEMRRAFDVQ